MKNIDELKALLITSFPQEKIYLFGSRARGTASPYSDYDIAIEGEASLKQRISLIQAEIEESTIPYKIDLVELSKAPYLREVVQEEGILWH